MQIIQLLVYRELAVSLAGGRVKIMPKSLIDDEIRHYILVNPEKIYSELACLDDDPLNDLNHPF